VIRWHRQAWRLFWRWRSRGPIGRPRLSAEVRELTAAMARDNPRCGSERIRGELLKLGIAVSKRSIQRYRRRGPAHPSSQTWRTFLTNHAHHVWAADLLTVQTLTLNVTANPTAAWIWRQVIEATPWGHTPRHLLHDHDAAYGRDFRQRARRIGIDAIATPIASPRANAIVERFIGTLRRECLDHLIILDERHLSDRCSMSSSGTTTSSGRTGHSASRRRCRYIGRPRDQCGRGRCSVAFITCTSEQPDSRADFCAPTPDSPRHLQPPVGGRSTGHICIGAPSTSSRRRIA
jgi:transposase InsO family protein